MWTQEEARFEGSYYQVRGAINQPKGVQHPHIPLLIGGSGEQVTLKLVAPSYSCVRLQRRTSRPPSKSARLSVMRMARLTSAK
jgi:hypothetical protein